MEIKVMFACGLEYEGQRHRSFTLRLPTLTDVERAIEAAQADAQAGPCAARWTASRPACRPPSPRARTSPIPSWLGPSPTACHMARPATQNARRVVAKWSQSQKKWDTVFCRYPIDFVVVRPAGIEPAAYCLGGRLYWRCHNLLQLLSRYIVVVDTVCDVARRDKDISLWSQNGRKGEYREGQEYGYSEKSHTLHRCAGKRE